MRCGACGQENREEARFCADCGSALAKLVTCAGCGTAAPAGRQAELKGIVGSHQLFALDWQT